MKTSAVNLQMPVPKGRVWSCSGKLSSVTREALISDTHRVSAKLTWLCLDKLCLCRNYPFIQLCPCPNPAPAAPPEAAALTRPRSLFLQVAAGQLQPSVHASFCFLQPHCLFPQRPLHEHCGGKGDPMARMLLECSRSCQLKDKDTPPQAASCRFRCQSRIPE